MLPEMRCGKGDNGRDWRSRPVPAHALDWISGSGSASAEPKRQAVVGLGLGWEWAHSEQQRQSMPQAQHLMRWGIGLAVSMNTLFYGKTTVLIRKSTFIFFKKSKSKNYFIVL